MPTITAPSNKSPVSASSCALIFGNPLEFVSRFIALSNHDSLLVAIFDAPPSAISGGGCASATGFVGLFGGVFRGLSLPVKDWARLIEIPKLERARNSYLDGRSFCAEFDVDKVLSCTIDTNQHLSAHSWPSEDQKYIKNTIHAQWPKTLATHRTSIPNTEPWRAMLL